MHAESSASPNENWDNDVQQSTEPSEAQSTFVQARQRRKIAELEEKLETLESGCALKERYVCYSMRWGSFAH